MLDRQEDQSVRYVSHAEGNTTAENVVAVLENMNPPIPKHTDSALSNVSPTRAPKRMHRTGSSFARVKEDRHGGFGAGSANNNDGP